LPSTDIKAVFWDNDGVLVDTEHLYFEATKRVLVSAGVPLTRDQYIDLFLRQGRGAWHLAEDAGVAPCEVERLRDERDALYARLLSEGSHAIDGVEEVLAELHGRVVMGIVTSSKRNHFDLIHRTSGLLRYVDFVLASGDYSRAKPHPDPYLKAIATAGVDADACVAIEDSERGLEAALGAGLRCIVVPTDLTRGCAFAGAAAVVATVADVPQELARRWP
jgi:HAD superfamily hydrolase (TIGR01509 family)